MLIKFILFSDSLSKVLILGNNGGNCGVFFLVDIRLLDINLKNNNFLLF